MCLVRVRAGANDGLRFVIAGTRLVPVYSERDPGRRAAFGRRVKNGDAGHARGRNVGRRNCGPQPGGGDEDRRSGRPVPPHRRSTDEVPPDDRESECAAAGDPARRVEAGDGRDRGDAELRYESIVLTATMSGLDGTCGWEIGRERSSGDVSVSG